MFDSISEKIEKHMIFNISVYHNKKQIMVLIGLMGKKGSGKTTGAQYLINKYHFVEESFANPLKKACQELFLLSHSQVFGTQEEKETPDPRWFRCSPRKILQYVGTDLLRDNLDKIMPGIGKDIFTHRFKLWYEEELIKNPLLCVVISDVRFQNEVDFIQSLGGTIIKINRETGIESDSHPSEMEMNRITNFDYLIDNNATLDEFYQKLNSCLSQLLIFQ